MDKSHAMNLYDIMKNAENPEISNEIMSSISRALDTLEDTDKASVLMLNNIHSKYYMRGLSFPRYQMTRQKTPDIHA